MGESSSRRSKKRSSKRRERRAKPVTSPSSPPSYSVEENSDGEWVNSRLNVKWPAPVNNDDHRYLSFDDESDRRQSERRSRKKKSKKEKKERKKRDESTKSTRASTTARSPLTSSESPYISLSTSDTEESGRSGKRMRRERKRMIVQTSPQMSKRSHHSGFATDEDGKKRVDSIVFDTRSEMKRYMKSDDILTAPKRKSRTKKHSASEQRENEEYNRYYLGVRSRRNVESKLKRPGEFALYYEKPREGEVPATVNLKIAYLSSNSEVFHFPIQCFEGPDGHSHFVVMQNKSDGKMFTSILSLVKHYSLYSHVDTRTGRLETFSVSH